MKVKFLDVIQMGTHLYKSGESGEFSDQTAEELIKKGLAVLDGDNKSVQDPADPPQTSKGGKGGKGGKGKNTAPPKDENTAGGNENNGSDDETKNSDDETKSDENTQTTNEDEKPE